MRDGQLGKDEVQGTSLSKDSHVSAWTSLWGPLLLPVERPRAGLPGIRRLHLCVSLLGPPIKCHGSGDVNNRQLSSHNSRGQKSAITVLAG